MGRFACPFVSLRFGFRWSSSSRAAPTSPRGYAQRSAVPPLSCSASPSPWLRTMPLLMVYGVRAQREYNCIHARARARARCSGTPVAGTTFRVPFSMASEIRMVTFPDLTQGSVTLFCFLSQDSDAILASLEFRRIYKMLHKRDEMTDAWAGYEPSFIF